MSAAYRLLEAASGLVRTTNSLDEEDRLTLGSRRALFEELSAQIQSVAGVSGGIQETVSALLKAAEEKIADSSAVEKGKGEEEAENFGVEEISTPALDKPQRAWANDIDNDRFTPFKPKLKIKPNSIAPLVMKTASVNEENDEVFGESLGPNEFYLHPYEHELQKLRYEKWQIEDASSA